MPLLNKKPSAPPVPTEPPIRVTSPDYRGATVDTRYTPLDSLLAFVQGSPWECTYYSRVLDDDDPLTGFSLNQDPVHLQYKEIKQFELRVTSALSPSQNPDTNAPETTGTSNVFPMLIPNVGDLFLADIGDGREGLFQVTSSSRKSLLKHAIHEIEYKMISYANPAVYQDLATKTIDTVVFVYDYMQTGQNPLVRPELQVQLEELKILFHSIAGSYVRSFLSNEYKTFLVPEQPNTIYDPYLTAAVLSYLTTFDTPEIRQVRKLNCDGDDVIKAVSLWTVLTQGDPILLKRCATRVGLVGARSFSKEALLEGIFYSGINQVVYLKDPDLSIDAKRNMTQKATYADLSPSDDPTEDTNEVRVLPLVAETDYYVLTEAFYKKSAGQMSQLELEVWKYLDREALDVGRIFSMAQSYVVWSDLERFYLGPVLLILMKAAMRST